MCTPNWATRPVFGTPADGVYCLKVGWLQFLNVAGLRPLSGIRFRLHTHETVFELLFWPKDRVLRTAVVEVDVFGSRAAYQAQNAMNFWCLRRVHV